jgi:hypothetical protein
VCASLTNDAPAAQFTCPGIPCAGCTGPTTGGGTIADGTYFFTGGVVYASACGALDGQDAHGKLVVQAGTIEYAYEGPLGVTTGVQGSQRESYAYSVHGAKIALTPLCSDGGTGSGDEDFAAQGDVLAIPIGPFAQTSFYRRQ